MCTVSIGRLKTAQRAAGRISTLDMQSSACLTAYLPGPWYHTAACHVCSVFHSTPFSQTHFTLPNYLSSYLSCFMTVRHSLRVDTYPSNYHIINNGVLVLQCPCYYIPIFELPYADIDQVLGVKSSMHSTRIKVSIQARPNNPDDNQKIRPPEDPPIPLYLYAPCSAGRPL